MEDGVDGIAGEVRRLNIIYFLSRLGKMEHAHLFRVQHHNRSGICLRDVKRWLGELRGKNMPDSFTWSCKRRYKSGFLWQDLLDDDFITPTADNEYVLKGSEIVFPFESCICRRTQNEWKPEEARKKVDIRNPKLNIHLHSISEISVPSTKTSRIEEDFEASDSETLASTEVSFKSITNALNSLESKSATTSEIEELGEEDNDKSLVKEEGEVKEQAKTFSTRKSKPRLSDLMNWGGVDISGTNCDYSPNHDSSALICRLDTFGGSERKSNEPSLNQRQANYASTAGKAQKKSKDEQAFEAYKPLREPRCSQCGKRFKPEKLYAHMKSCKVFGRNRAVDIQCCMRSQVPYTI